MKARIAIVNGFGAIALALAPMALHARPIEYSTTGSLHPPVQMH